MGKGDIMNEINSLVMTLVTGLFMLIGLIIITFTKNNEKVVNFSISMAFGVMVMLVILKRENVFMTKLPVVILQAKVQSLIKSVRLKD